MSKPIRVLQVVTHMNRGGLETMLMNYYRHIDREKVQFDFLVHRHERAAYDNEIEALGGRIYRLPRLVPWSISYHRALNAFFEEHTEYRVVHVHQDCLSSVILKVAQKHGIPVRIAHSHSTSQDKDLKYIIKLICKKSIPDYATELFACGKEAGQWMFGGAPFRILNNAIDAEQYRVNPARAASVRNALKIPADALVVGHVGRFSPPKNHNFLIDIFAEIHRLEPNAYLLLVGDGELRPGIEEKVWTRGLDNNVIFTGVRSDVPDLMQTMDVFVFPSLYEGLGIVIIEAQAAGIPCVISDNIPSACDLTELIHRLSLDEPAKRWAQKAFSLQKDDNDNYMQIAEAGFDIEENAQWLQNYYLSCNSI